jgi:hypothetical protein
MNKKKGKIIVNNEKEKKCIVKSLKCKEKIPNPKNQDIHNFIKRIPRNERQVYYYFHPDLYLVIL